MDANRGAAGARPTSRARSRTSIRGAVQGVGFRPFVFRLATELGLTGWVNNSAQGVLVEIEGPKSQVDEFLSRLGTEKPPQSFIQSLETSRLDPVGYTDFQIRESEQGGPKSALVMPDIATCAECLAEIFDPKNRRYGYPFTNCTNCGPRFSIIEALPYDRANTSMKRFKMCAECQTEYEDPRNRRFHAQPNACPICGPQLEFWAGEGKSLATGEQALAAAAEAIRGGRIVAVKGVGGFHLMVAAANEATVQRLRERKHREEKPFALMFPSLGAVREVCEVSTLEERLLRSPEAPIVLLRRLAAETNRFVSRQVAPGNPNLGVLLPYSPLHHLLLRTIGHAVVATSGNLSDEPICTDEREALQRLSGIADFFLVHNRPIVRHVDDSIVRVMAGRELVLRRARGFAPLPLPMYAASSTEPQKSAVPHPEASILAVGAHLKNAVALSVGKQVFISQHIGDLETDQAYEAFGRVITDLQTLYESPASKVIADSHPDYLSTKFAQSAGVPCVFVQHHLAHVLSCMAENDVKFPALGVSWDGTGFGLDGTVWGGEFFKITKERWDRIAHFRCFRLPGGEQAVREPRRSALGLLFEVLGDVAFEQSDLATIGAFSLTELSGLKIMLRRELNSPRTSSAGRLFDAIGSLTGLRQVAHFEGQAAMELEFSIGDTQETGAYDLSLDGRSTPIVVDWQSAVESILNDLRDRLPTPTISARFHNTLVEAILKVARCVGLQRVILSGGCFQNRFLTEAAVRRLEKAGFRAYWHQRVPPNDGGICLGQVVAARLWKV